MTAREPYDPCIDDSPHVFTSGTRPAAFSYTSPELVIFCSRCGHTRETLDPEGRRTSRRRVEMMMKNWPGGAA